MNNRDLQQSEDRNFKKIISDNKLGFWKPESC